MNLQSVIHNPRSSVAQSAGPQAEVIRILLIEDRPEDAQLLWETLRESNAQAFEVLHVCELSEGLERLARERFDLVLLDLNLPDSAGIETLARLQSESPDVPVVILTGLDDADVAVQAIRLGAQDFLSKDGLTRRSVSGPIRYAIERYRMLSLLCQQAEELHATEDGLQALLTENADGIAVVGRDGAIQFVNPAAESLFGAKEQELRGKPFGFPVAVGETTELDIVRAPGDATVVEMRAAEIQWQGEWAYLASLRDITDRVKQREQLRQLATTDELTGLHNRRAFLELGGQQVKLADRAKSELVLVYVDVDRMKAIDDTLGHLVGDQALLDTAFVLVHTFRESDLVARIGGDEFAVLAIEAGLPAAKVLDARLKDRLKGLNAESNREFELSLTTGVAVYDPHKPGTFQELIHQADVSMLGGKMERSEAWNVKRET